MRMSPMHDCLRRLDPVWGELNGMPIARAFPANASSAIQVCDLSALSRTGLKGSGAASWLQSRNFAVPARPNSWTAIEGEGLIARLGRAEFLVEDGLRGGVANSLAAELVTPAANIYPVLRQDAALLVRGDAVFELFAQTCDIDFQSMPRREQIVTLTMMAGIAVTVIDVSSAHALPCYRVWCDGTYGAYLWDTLLEIALELGGGAAGLASVFPELAGTQK